MSTRFRLEKIAAVVAAPAAADMPAITANVALDMFETESRYGYGLKMGRRLLGVYILSQLVDNSRVTGANLVSQGTCRLRKRLRLPPKLSIVVVLNSCTSYQRHRRLLNLYMGDNATDRKSDQ